MNLKLETLSRKKFRFKWEESIHKTFIEVSIPDISRLKYSYWADWGAMYTFIIDKLDPILIKYNNDLTESRQKKLHIHSPILATEREVYPYFLKIEDEIRSVVFNLFINKDYELGKVEIVKGEQSIKLFEVQNEALEMV